MAGAAETVPQSSNCGSTAVEPNSSNPTKSSIGETLPRAPENECYEIRTTPSKGYGCFALKDLKRGTRILADSPLLIVPIAHYLQSDVDKAFENLSSSEKDLYFSLASGHSQDPKNWPSKIHPTVKGRELQRIKEQHGARIAKDPSVVSIFQTNCMEMDDGAAVFPHAARFNHSCKPNANFSWNPNIEKETIHIINDVKKDEEITLSYCDMTHDKKQRAWELKHYGFSCDCPACADDEDDPESYAYKSAERRFRIAELERATKHFRGQHLDEGIEQPDFPNQLLELAALHKEEGDYSVRLAHIYLDLTLVCESYGDFKNGTICAAQALKVKRECQGVDSSDYEKFTRVLKRLNEKHKAQG